MQKHGHVFHGGAENISVGVWHPLQAILSLLIDDGVPSKGHRKNILNPAHRCIGLSTVSHKMHGTFTVMKYAFFFQSKKEPNLL
jgi:uncharacterized protein YkwD